MLAFNLANRSLVLRNTTTAVSTASSGSVLSGTEFLRERSPGLFARSEEELLVEEEAISLSPPPGSPLIKEISITQFKRTTPLNFMGFKRPPAGPQLLSVEVHVIIKSRKKHESSRFDLRSRRTEARDCRALIRIAASD